MKKNFTRIIISNYDEMNNPYYSGGGAYAIQSLAKRLSKNYEVTVLTSKYPNYSVKNIEGLKYKYIGISALGPKAGQIIYQILLPFYAKKLTYDIWIESFTPPISTAFLTLFTKKPVIGLTHFLDSKSKSKQYKLPFFIFEYLGIKKYSYFIALTESVKQRILSMNKNATIVVIPNGIELRKNSISEKTRHILFIGRIEEFQKGLDLLVNSYSKIYKEIGLPLLIAGNGNAHDIESLKSKIRELGIEKNVKFIGKITGKRKDRIFNESALITIPSRFETQPIAALEAMSYGIPLLVYDIDGFKWIKNNCAVKVKPFDTEIYSDKMKMLVQDKKLQKTLKENAAKFVSQFNWDILFKNYVSFIEKVNAHETKQ